MNRNLIFLEQYTSDFRGEKYEVYKFMDEITLKIFYGTNLSVGELTRGKTYKGTLDIKSFNGQDKIKVTSIKES